MKTQDIEEKIMLSLRLEDSLYRKLMEHVFVQKQNERGYSANKFICELIKQALVEKEADNAKSKT